MKKNKSYSFVCIECKKESGFPIEEVILPKTTMESVFDLLSNICQKMDASRTVYQNLKKRIEKLEEKND
jgi:hypothetical protein